MRRELRAAGAIAFAPWAIYAAPRKKPHRILSSDPNPSRTIGAPFLSAKRSAHGWRPLRCSCPTIRSLGNTSRLDCRRRPAGRVRSRQDKGDKEQEEEAGQAAMHRAAVQVHEQMPQLLPRLQGRSPLLRARPVCPELADGKYCCGKEGTDCSEDCDCCGALVCPSGACCVSFETSGTDLTACCGNCESGFCCSNAGAECEGTNDCCGSLTCERAVPAVSL